MILDYTFSLDSTLKIIPDLYPLDDFIQRAGGSCDNGWHFYNGNCFYMSTTKAVQPKARSACLAMDADLASITDEAEMNFVIGES